MLLWCEDWRGGVIENMIIVLTANCYKDICSFYSLPHLTNEQHKNILAHAQSHIPQCIAFI